MTCLIDEQLNQIFGQTFAPVIEYEVCSELHIDLLSALRTNPDEALGVLKRVFRSEGTVALIFGLLADRLRKLEGCQECKQLLDVINPLLPSGVGLAR